MTRRETDALIVPLCGDWSAALTNIRRDRKAVLTPTIWLERDGDGAVWLTDPIALETSSGRNEWATRAAAIIADPGVSATAIAGQLECAIPAAIERLQGESGRPSQADRLVELAADAELFHNAEGDTFAMILVDGHRETHALKSKGFRRWLHRRYYDECGKAPGSQATQDALSVLDGQASFGGEEHVVAVRLAECDGAYCVDLGDPGWRAVRIDAHGWGLDPMPEVRFRRPKGLLPLPAPTSGGGIALLRPFLNIVAAAFSLIVAWLLAALRPTGPYPILVLNGEQGTAKSTTARVLRSLLDPNAAALRSQPDGEKDLIIAATNGAVLVYDNLSSIPGWLSDAFCRLATGGGFATRELYSDADETLFAAQRPIILNGIPDLATRADLLSRSIVVTLPPIPAGQRQPEAAFWTDFEAARPAILGALLDGVCAGIAGLPHVSLPELPRMADFAMWSCAALPGVGIAADTFLEAYRDNIAAANEAALEASPLVPPIRALLDRAPHQTWQGSATELLAILEASVDDAATRRRGWPGNPRSLSAALRRIAPNLRAERIGIETAERTKDGRVITIRIMPDNLRHLRHHDGNRGEFSCVEAKNSGDANGDANDANATELVLRHRLCHQGFASAGGENGDTERAHDADDAKILDRSNIDPRLGFINARRADRGASCLPRVLPAATMGSHACLACDRQATFYPGNALICADCLTAAGQSEAR